MYKLTQLNIVVHLDTGDHIPMSTDNQDYRDYLAWLAAGNTPEPADTHIEDPNVAILDKIAAIERDRQPRALREYFLKNDKTALADIDTEIESLRAQLVTQA